MRNLMRWNPRNEVEVNDPFSAFEQMIDDMWQSWPSRVAGDGERQFMRPAMDVVENEKDLTVRIDLPGIKPDDVNVEVEDQTLTVSGKTSDTVEREGDRYHYRERRVGSFQRSIRLPNTLDTDKADASFENGVLNITFPKLPQAQPKQISIKAKNK